MKRDISLDELLRHSAEIQAKLRDTIHRLADNTNAALDIIDPHRTSHPGQSEPTRAPAKRILPIDAEKADIASRQFTSLASPGE